MHLKNIPHIAILVGLSGCATMHWAPREKPIGKPTVTPVEEPKYVTDAHVAPPAHLLSDDDDNDAAAGEGASADDEVVIDVLIRSIPRDRYAQDYRVFQASYFDEEDARSAGTTWLAGGGTTALLSLIFFAKDEETGEAIAPTVGVIGLLTSVGLAAVGGAQFAAPHLPSLRRDVRREPRTWIEEGQPVPAAGVEAWVVRTDDGDRLAEASTDASGVAALRVPAPPPDAVEVFTAGEKAAALDLISTGGWLSTRVKSIRDLAAAGEVESAKQIVARGEEIHGSDLWGPYCKGIAPTLAHTAFPDAVAMMEGAPGHSTCSESWAQVAHRAAVPLAEAAIAKDAAQLDLLQRQLEPALEWQRLRPQLDACMAASRATEDRRPKLSSYWERLEELDRSDFEPVRMCSDQVRALMRPLYEEERREEAEKERRKRLHEAAVDAFYRDEGLSEPFTNYRPEPIENLLATYAGCDATRVLGIPDPCARQNARVISQFRGMWCSRNWNRAVTAGGRVVAEDVRHDFCEYRFGGNPHIGTDGCIKVLKAWCP